MKTKPSPSATAAETRNGAPPAPRGAAAGSEYGPMMQDLHRRAVAQMRMQRKNQKSEAKLAKSEPDAQRLLHELQVHQVELELQNAELQEARDRSDALLENYTDLYDFAPVGYFTLSNEGRIIQVNLTGARLVGMDRSRLVGQPFGGLLSVELRPVFNSFLQQIFAEPAQRSGDFELSGNGQAARAVSIEARRLPNGRECRAVMMDITARRDAERTLSEQARLLDLTHDAIIVRDLEGCIRYWNHGAEELYGWSRQEALGQTSHHLLHTEYLTPLKQLTEELHRTNRWTGELVHTKRDGRRITVLVRKTLDRDREGHPASVLENISDITGRKQAEEDVRVSEIRYRRLFEAAHDGVLLLDPATRKITDANPFMTTLLGYPRATLVGKELFEIGLLKDEAASQGMFRRLKRRHEARYEDLPLESQDGRHHEVEVVANLYQENGHAVIQCNLRDITERKRSENALRNSQALFSALIDQAPFGVYVVDARFCMQQVNRKARPAFRKISRLVGRGFSEVVHLLWPKQVADAIEKRFRHTLTTGEPYQSPEFTARRRDNGVREDYEWQIQRVTLPHGEHGVVCFFQDITARKRAEETQRRVEVLAASNRKLEKEIVRRQAMENSLRTSDQHQTRLLEQSRRLQEQLRQLSRQILTVQEEERRQISRELHDVVAQTLTGINVRLAALKKQAATTTAGLDRDIVRTQRLVEKSVDIVHRFARELRPTALDDLGLVPALHSFMKSFTTRTGVRTHLKVFAAIEKVEGAKRTVLYRVAQEALTNVARHAKASRVEVSIQKLQGGVCMKIKDDGKSFDAERVLRTLGKGRLGLLGMRERVEMVGGNFTVESAPGQGTTIVAHLPFGKVAGGGAETAEGKT